MKIAIGSDHRGYEIKQHIIGQLRALGHEVFDLGPDSESSVDYPDFAFQVGEFITSGQAERGVLICGTSIGMCIAANKVPGIRAAPCYDTVTAEVSRRHNDANVICLSADLLGEEIMERMIRIWIDTPFEGGRHARRVEKIQRYEANHLAPDLPGCNN